MLKLSTLSSHSVIGPLARFAAVLGLVLAFSAVQRAVWTLFAPGDLDPTFGNGGIVITPNGSVNAEAIQADGKIVVVGESGGFLVSRYNTDGSVDTNFGDNGRVVTSVGGLTRAEGVAIQPDGKIIAAGRTSGAVSSIARFNADGSLDSSFADGGVINAGIAGNLRSVLLQSDGKIVVAGDRNGFLAVRLNPDGTFDSSFGSGGIVVTPITSGMTVTAAVVDETGRIVLAGHTFAFDDRDISLAAYTVNGTLDSSFGSDGIVLIQVSGHQIAEDLALHGSGYVVSGYQGVSILLARFTHDGSLDTQFGNGGMSVIPFAEGSAFNEGGLVVQPDNKIMAAGYIHNLAIALVRCNPDGSLDNGFGTGGKVVTSTGTGNPPFTQDLQLRPDGKYVVAGFISIPQPRSIFVARYQGDGGGPTPTATATPTATSTSTPTTTPTATPTGTPTSTPVARAAFDYDADGKSDISVFRPSSGAWYLQQSIAGLYGTEFGYNTDKITPADFDGDGKTDIAVYRPETGIWYVFRSSDGTVDYFVFGIAEDLPTPADYDGDGRADISVFRPETTTWYRQNSSDGSFYAIQFGASEDKPTIGDFDGDGKSDIAIFRPSVGDWYQLYSSDGSVHGQRFGFGTDIIVPADYDGDGHCDIAVFRPSTGLWYIMSSLNGQVVYAVFGLDGDIPAPGDFDGDGKADVSVFRPSDGTWYRTNSSDGSFFAYPFGANGDRPTQTAFTY